MAAVWVNPNDCLQLESCRNPNCKLSALLVIKTLIAGDGNSVTNNLGSVPDPDFRNWNVRNNSEMHCYGVARNRRRGLGIHITKGSLRASATNQKQADDQELNGD